MESNITVFRGKEVRRAIHNKEWWFSVVDVIAVLTDSSNPRDYWYKMKIRVKDEDGAELSTFCRQLKLKSQDGKKYETACAKLGEAATTEITRVDDAHGFHQARHSARKGGEVAGKARKDLEKKTGREVVSPENYLTEPEGRKRLTRK